MTQIDDLKKLPPEERIKKLKELAEKDKKEIEEAMRLIKESSLEAEEKQELLRKVPIPQIAAVNIESLFSRAEKEAYKTVRGVAGKDEKEENKGADKAKSEAERSALEETVAKEEPKISQAQLEEQKAYIHKLGTEELQKKRDQIYATAQEGYISQEQQSELYTIREEFEQRQKDFEAGNYKTESQKVADLLSGERQYK